MAATRDGVLRQRLRRLREQLAELTARQAEAVKRPGLAELLTQSTEKLKQRMDSPRDAPPPAAPSSSASMSELLEALWTGREPAPHVLYMSRPTASRLTVLIEIGDIRRQLWGREIYRRRTGQEAIPDRIPDAHTVRRKGRALRLARDRVR